MPESHPTTTCRRPLGAQRVDLSTQCGNRRVVSVPTSLQPANDVRTVGHQTHTRPERGTFNRLEHSRQLHTVAGGVRDAAAELGNVRTSNAEHYRPSTRAWVTRTSAIGMRSQDGVRG